MYCLLAERKVSTMTHNFEYTCRALLGIRELREMRTPGILAYRP